MKYIERKMKHNCSKKVELLLPLFVVLLTLSLASHGIETHESYEIIEFLQDNPCGSDIIYHDSIIIDGNGDFLSENGVFNPGASGTQIDPYILTNLLINGTGGESCIKVTNTNAFFIIENCKLYNSQKGIVLLNVSNAIINNTAIECLNGTNGNDGLDGTSSSCNGKNGGNGLRAVGISIINSSFITLCNNSIGRLKGGDGGSGGDGFTLGYSNGNGGCGGNGGSSIGIDIYGHDIMINENLIYDLKAGYGGNGGFGGSAVGGGPSMSDFFEYGLNGGNGGDAGNSFGIFLNSSYNINIHFSSFYFLNASNAGDGGDGHDGGRIGMGDLGWGGDGGDGGYGGNSSAIYSYNSSSLVISNNYIKYLYNGTGGEYGTKGSGSPNGENGITGPDGNVPAFSMMFSNASLIYDNSIFSELAIDNGINNKWNTTNHGNYWNTYDTSGVVFTLGVGDIPFAINGSAHNYDFKPLQYSFIFDSDGDTIMDVEELSVGVDHFITDRFNIDTDGDLIEDNWELGNNTDPSNNDTDDDGMPDGWEVKYVLNPLSDSDPFLDLDSDNLQNIYEFLNGTDPNNPDTDGDGCSDYEEINKNTDPLDSNDNPAIREIRSKIILIGMIAGIIIMVISGTIRLHKEQIRRSQNSRTP